MGGAVTNEWRLTVFATDPDTASQTIADLAEGPLDALLDLVERHDYMVGKPDPIFGAPITGVVIQPLSVALAEDTARATGAV